MKAALASALIERAGGICECSCGRPFDSSLQGTRTFDHSRGRARAPDSLESIWVLRNDCHRRKTDNAPSASQWLGLFLVHQERHGYDSTETKKRLEWVLVKGELSKGAA